MGMRVLAWLLVQTQSDRVAHGGRRHQGLNTHGEAPMSLPRRLTLPSTASVSEHPEASGATLGCIGVCNLMLLSSHRGKVAQEEATRPTREGSGPAPLTALSGCADTQSSRDRREHAVTIADMVPASLFHRLPALHTEIDLARDAAQGRLRDSRAAGQPPSCVSRRIARTSCGRCDCRLFRQSPRTLPRLLPGRLCRSS